MALSFQTYIVRPRISDTEEDQVLQALGKAGMSKFAGCPDTINGAVFDRTLDRFLTGFDENHPDVLNLPEDERLARQAEIKEEREFLEKELGKSLHHTNTDFWENLQIVLDRGKMFNTAIPMDRIKVSVLRAGKIVPLSKEDIDNPDYNGTSFYIGTEFDDVDDKVLTRTKEREVAIKTEELLEKFSYAVEISKYLGIDGVSERMPRANMDDILSTWLENSPKHKEKFLDAMKETEDFIRLSNKFKEFRSLRLVNFEDGKFVAGKTKLAATEKLSVKKLLGADPNMQAVLAQLLEDSKELRNKN